MALDIQQLLRDKIADAANGLYGSATIQADQVLVEHPDNPKHGDYSTNTALKLSKTLNLTPVAVVEALANELRAMDLSFQFDAETYVIFSKIETVGGFLNFYLSPIFLKNVLKEIALAGDTFGKSDIGEGSKILIEFSQPNPNKPMHIGHARNNFIGSSLANILAFVGYDVVRVNYINDWGTHICKSMLMYVKHFDGQEPVSKPDYFIGTLYTQYEREVQTSPELEKELAEMFLKLEAGDPAVTELWEKIVGWVYQGWEATYADQDVAFDVWMYQSAYTEQGKEIVATAIEKGIAEKDETGAVIARLEKFGLPDKVLLRSDGTSIYATQDLQLAKDSYDKYAFFKRLYVVDFRQSDYFKQIFKISAILGYPWAKDLVHIAYGTVDLPEGAMSSRRGNVVNSDDVYNKLVELEKEEIGQSAKAVENVLDTSKKLALAAFRYSMLKVDPKQDITFMYSQVTKFDGNTGPYILYTYARAISILEKSDFVLSEFDPSVVLGKFEVSEVEVSALRELLKFGEVAREAASEYAPNVLANYLFTLCHVFNSFYSSASVLNTEDLVQRRFRLSLVFSISQVIRSVTSLLGIKVVDKM